MQVLKEDIRGRILTVARQQFERKGYSKTSMREVAELAGVGVGNIYNYFTNKDELFREVVRPVLYALEAMLQEHHGIGTPRHTRRGHYDDAVGEIPEILHRRICFAD